MPYLTDAESKVRAEVRWCEFSVMEAKRAAVSWDWGDSDGDGRREEGQERVECVRRLI